jgi:predicted lipid-binding transport protein (Tim44 family)
MSSKWTLSRGSLKILAFAALIALAPALAEAKMGGGGSFGSRGSRTFSAPPPTRTAPSTAAPMDRSITSPERPSFNPGAASRPSMGGGFGRGLLGGLAGGLLGAGLFGLLTGNGLLGGMGGFMSFIGLLLQIGLLVFLARLAFNWFAGRNAAAAGAGGRQGPNTAAFTGGPGVGGGGGARPQGGPIRPSPEDFSAFERLLSQTQDAYSREDASALRRLTTPEMVSYFEEELEANRGKGVVNRISGVKLLQGDLSEAWREGADEYATVAMRFELTDVMEERATGKIVSGDGQPSQSTEIWTFRRPAGAGPDAWRLSAIQQTA